MASHQELFFDWNSLTTSVDEKYKTVSRSDIHLASEIGIRLLERCNTLEETVKRQEDKLEQQMLEIEYLDKHSAALREINNSRLKIYEELEVGIVELEQQNHNLKLENNSNKTLNQSQNLEIQKLDTMCFDLNEEIKSLQKELIAEKRKIELLKERNTADKTCDSDFLDKNDLDLNESSSTSLNKSKSLDVNHINISIQTSPTDNEDFLKIMMELDRTKMELKSEKNKVFELEDQIFSIIQENQNLQARFTQETVNENFKSVQQEFALLEDVREGAMCSRCLILINEQICFEEHSSIGETEVYDNDTILESINEEQSSEILPKTSTPLKQSSYNDLVEKYEAFIKVLRPATRKTTTSNSDSTEEPKTVSKENYLNNISEADTSSGFSESTTSKDGSLSDNRSQERFLCTLEDGDDFKINIYDASKNNCSRFRNMPDYREIYKEIFTILEKSNKVMLSKNINKTTNIKRHLKNIIQAEQTDSNASEKSIISKDNKNKTKNKSLNKKNNIKKSEESSSSSSSSSSSQTRGEEVSKTSTTLQENKSVHTKYEENDPYEYILVTKKNRKNNRNLDKSDKIPVSPESSTNGIKDKKRNVNNKTNAKNRNPITISNTSDRSSSSNNFNFKNHDLKMTSVEFKPSTLSKDLSKLKQLEFSYANVLRAH